MASWRHERSGRALETMGRAASLVARSSMARSSMARSLAGAAVVLLGAWALGACSVGEGQGEVGGPVVAVDCEVEQPAYALEPSFFAGEVSGDQLTVRVQRGSDLEGFADGLMLLVKDVNEVRRQRIGLPIPVDASSESPVQAVLYLNETCKSGFPDEFGTQPLILEAVSGSVTFDSVYAPDIEAGATAIEGELSELRFEDPERPEERNATMSGWFSFFYQRGGPAQRFP